MRAKVLISWFGLVSISVDTSVLKAGITPQLAREHACYTTPEVGLFKCMHYVIYSTLAHLKWAVRRTLLIYGWLWVTGCFSIVLNVWCCWSWRHRDSYICVQWFQAEFGFAPFYSRSSWTSLHNHMKSTFVVLSGVPPLSLQLFASRAALAWEQIKHGWLLCSVSSSWRGTGV